MNWTNPVVLLHLALLAYLAGFACGFAYDWALRWLEQTPKETFDDPL